MSMHEDIQSLRDGYLKTAKQMRELNKQGYATHREIMAQVCEDLAQRLDGILERYEGYVVVPREPTRDMLIAGQYAKRHYPNVPSGTSAESVWIAMIEAAEQKP